MRKIILSLFFTVLFLSVHAQNFTTGTWNKVNAKDTLWLSGRGLAEVVYSVLSTSKNNEIPTAKSVWDLVQSQIGDKISGTGEAPRVAYFTGADQIGGDPDLTFDDADNILLVQDITLDGSNNEITAQSFNGEYFGMSGLNAAGYVVSTATSGASSGAYLALRSNDNSPMANGDRLGAITFGGATTGPGSSNEGIKLEAFAEGAYSGSSQPTGLRISTIPTSSNTATERLWLSQNGDLSILGGKENRWWDTDGSNYVGFKAPALSSNYTYTLPTDFGTIGYQLTTDGSGTLSWTAQSGAVSQPNLQIVSGTGSSITSSADFTHDITNNRIFAQDTFMTYEPAFINVPSAWRSRMLGRPDMGIVAQHTQADPSALTQMSLAYYTLGVGVATSSAAATACPSIRFYKAKVSAGNAVAGTAGESLAFFGFQNHKGDVTHFNDFYNHTNGGYIFNAIIDSVASDGSVSSRTDFYAKPITGTAAAPSGTRFLSGRGSGDIYLPAYSPSRNDAGTPAVVLSVDASNRVTAHPVSELPGGATDHGALTGLSDDDHTQYLLLAGRSGGQIATGGTASGDDITLRSTTNATKGDVILNDQGGNVIIGGGEFSGELRFLEPSGSGSNYTGFKSGAMSADQMYTLPIDVPANGEVLKWNTGGTLSWDTDASGGTNYQTWKKDGTSATQQPNANFVTSSTIAPTLTNDAGNSETEASFDIVANSINAFHLNQMGASTNQVLTWDGSTWAAAYTTDDIYPSDITVDVNDYSPTGWSTNSEVFISSTSIRTITGFEALPGGTVRHIINDGDYPYVIAAHHTASSVGNRVFAREDIIVLPQDGVTLVYNNNASRWFVAGSSFNPTKMGSTNNGIYYYQAPGSTNQSDHSFLGFANSGTSSGNANANPASKKAISWELATGTTAAGVATIYFPKNANNYTRTGDGHIVIQANVYVPTLSTGSQRYTLQVGIIPNANTTTLAVNNSVVVRYKDDVNSGKFELVTRNSAGTETAVDCGVTVAANTTYQITVVLNEALTEARAYINTPGAVTAFATNTSTMPNSAVSVGGRCGIFASVGTTTKLLNVGLISGFVVL